MTESYRAYQAAYRLANRAALKEKRDANRDAINRRKRAYRAENRATIKPKRALYRLANRDAINRRKREIYANRPIPVEEPIIARPNLYQLRLQAKHF